jgi:hypothetical protein
MDKLVFQRSWWVGSVGSVLLLAGCGGDGNTGPGGDGGGMNGSLPGTHQLIGVNRQALPVVTEPEDCTQTRFSSGKLVLTGDGGWDIFVDWSDENGNFQLQDGGDWEQEDDGHLLFHSVGGDLYGGIVYDDAIVVTLDFCHNGQPETEFGFER